MTMDLLLLFVLVGLLGPVVACAVAVVAGRGTAANTLVQTVLAASSFVGLAGSALAFYGVVRGLFPAVSAVIPGVNVPITLDAWSSAFLILINLGTLLASLFAISYLPKYANVYSFPSLNAVSALFIVGMQVTVLSSSVFVFLFFWEVMSVAAYFLVTADREEDSLKAGLIYFIMTHLGVACLFAGFLVLAQGDAFATFASLRSTTAALPPSSLALAFFLLFAGFGSKAGLVPLHQWLPYAHPQAPSHSSALLSGVMLKVAVYGFLRVTLFVFPQIPLAWAVIVVVVGLLSALFGVLSASVEADLKRLLAWSSVENLGLIFAMIGTGFVFRKLELPSTPLFVAALIHTFSHMIFKTGLFLGAGAVISETHTRNLDDMGGLAKSWPVFSAGFLGLALGAAALPPFSTFYGEWLLLQSLAANALTTSRVAGFLFILVIAAVALVGGLAIFTFAKAFSAIFLSKPRTDHAAQVKPLVGMLTLPVMIGAVLLLVAGVFAAPLTAMVNGMMGSSPATLSGGAALVVAGGTITPMFVFLLAVLAALIALGVRHFATDQRAVRITDTWDCGQPITARMEYTATGFAAPIRFFFRRFLLSEKRMVTERVTEENPWILKRRLEWSTASLWEEYAYAPLARAVLRISVWIKRLQSGVIQFYILLVLLTLVLVLMFAV